MYIPLGFVILVFRRYFFVLNAKVRDRKRESNLLLISQITHLALGFRNLNVVSK